MLPRLSAAEQKTLLSLAHDAVCAAVQELPLNPVNLDSLSDRLREPRASFVTITLQDKLRGCIGTVEKCYPLAQDVVLRATSAATRDPRFNPLQTSELDQISIEVSVLSDPEMLEYKRPEELASRLTPGLDGVIIRHQAKRATFLPQVWERVQNPEQFLTLLCRKASLADEFWKTGDLQVSVYRVEAYHR